MGIGQVTLQACLGMSGSRSRWVTIPEARRLLRSRTLITNFSFVKPSASKKNVSASGSKKLLLSKK